MLRNDIFRPFDAILKISLWHHDVHVAANSRLAYLKEQETTSELARSFEVVPSQIIQWKKGALSQLESLFGSKYPGEESAAKNELLFGSQPIASLVFASSVAYWVFISCSQYYYKPCGESENNLQVIRIMDRQYTEFPTSGARTM